MTSERLATAQVDSVLSADGRRPARPRQATIWRRRRQAQRPISERLWALVCGLTLELSCKRVK
jgi:hypothetical protein